MGWAVGINRETMSALSFLIEEISNKQKAGLLGAVYFRGQNAKHTLVPRLLRADRKFKHSIDDTENMIFTDAWIMGATELAGTRNSWEALALFQHYEIPTRLLDWSSSLPSALFFAVQKCLSCDKQGKCEKLRKSCNGNPVIWVLDPIKMHHRLHAGKPAGSLSAITIGIDQIQDYKEEFVIKDASTNDWDYKAGPVFLEVPWMNARMRSQKGFFTFHYDDIPLENLLDETSGLIKIDLRKRYRSTIVEEFNALGLNEHDIFTDLVSLANFFKRRYTIA